MALLSHPGTRMLAGAPERQVAVAGGLGELDGDEDGELTVRYRHVQEDPGISMAAGSWRWTASRGRSTRRACR